MKSKGEKNLLRCRGCGKVIGKLENTTIVVRHKGRTISFPQSKNGKNVMISCETCGSENYF